MTLKRKQCIYGKVDEDCANAVQLLRMIPVFNEDKGSSFCLKLTNYLIM